MFPQSNGFAEEPFGDLLFAARICIQSQVHPDFGEVRVESTRHVQEAIRHRVISFYRFENAKQIVSEEMTRIEFEFLRQLMADFRDRTPIICAKQSVGPLVVCIRSARIESKCCFVLLDCLAGEFLLFVGSANQYSRPTRIASTGQYFRKRLSSSLRILRTKVSHADGIQRLGVAPNFECMLERFDRSAVITGLYERFPFYRPRQAVIGIEFCGGSGLRNRIVGLAGV